MIRKTGLWGASVTAIVLASGALFTACADLPKGTTTAAVRPVQTATPAMSRVDNYYAAAVGAIERRDYARALESLQAARAESPSDVRVLNAFGVVYDKLGRFDLSARYYGQARAADPQSRVVESNMAYSTLLSGKPAPAEAMLASIDARPAPAAAPTLAPAPAPAARESAKISVSTAPATISPAPAPELATRRAEMPTAPRMPAALLASAPARPVGPSPSAPVAAKPALLEQPRTAIARFARAQAQAPTPVRSAKPPTTQASRRQPAPTASARLQDPAVRAAPAGKVAMSAAPSRRPVAGGVGKAGATGFAVARPPLYIVNASGQPGRGEPIRVALANKGWSTPKSALLKAPAQAHSIIHYPPDRRPVALALAMTLPGKTQLAPCACSGLKLVLGRDANKWRAPAPQARSRQGRA